MRKRGREEGWEEEAADIMLVGPILASYPRKSAYEIHPLLAYCFCGLDGTLDGRFPLLLHVFHSFLPGSPTFRTNARASLKGR